MLLFVQCSVLLCLSEVGGWRGEGGVCFCPDGLPAMGNYGDRTSCADSRLQCFSAHLMSTYTQSRYGLI